MTDLQSRLFDVTDYGGEQPTALEARRAAQPQRAYLPVEDHLEGWFVMRNRTGVYPFFHLENSRNEHGSVVTVCGLIGTKITNDGVRQMVRCPSCDLGAQLKA